MANVEFGAGNPIYPLLFDPQVSKATILKELNLCFNLLVECIVQTSGGLLATVPEDRADAAVEALRSAGYPASAVIGRVIPREAGEFAPLVYLE